MPKYRITALSFIDNRLVKEGEEIETDAIPGPHWEPLDKKAEKISADAAAADEARIKEMQDKQSVAESAIQTLANAGVDTAALAG